VQSKAATVSQYLRELPAERRAAIAAVRKVILANLDDEFEEGMQYGMIAYYVRYRVRPPGYHCDPKQPLTFAGLASPKNYMSLYLMSIYSAVAAKAFQAAWARAGKKLDIGKARIHFKKLGALDVIALAVGGITAQEYIQQCESTMREHQEQRSTRATAKKPPRRENEPAQPRAAVDRSSGAARGALWEFCDGICPPMSTSSSTGSAAYAHRPKFGTMPGLA
jgi:hypothetical protein